MFFPSFPLFHFPFPLCYLLLLRSREPGWTAECEAENASRPPLPCAAPRRTALAGSHHSPWWGSGTSRRRGGKVGRSAGVRDQCWTSLWADKPGRPGRNRGRSPPVGRQELLRRVHKLSMVSCGQIRASLYLLVVLCDFSACHLCSRATPRALYLIDYLSLVDSLVATPLPCCACSIAFCVVRFSITAAAAATASSSSRNESMF